MGEGTPLGEGAPATAAGDGLAVRGREARRGRYFGGQGEQ